MPSLVLRSLNCVGQNYSFLEQESRRVGNGWEADIRMFTKRCGFSR
jgi:hypothetical protein